MFTFNDVNSNYRPIVSVFLLSARFHIKAKANQYFPKFLHFLQVIGSDDWWIASEGGNLQSAGVAANLLAIILAGSEVTDF